MINFLKGIFVVAFLMVLSTLSYAQESEGMSSITIRTASAWYARIWPDVAIVGYGSGTFETARVERPNLLRAIFKEIESSLDVSPGNVSVDSNSVSIYGKTETRQYSLNEAVIKHVLDVLSVDWRPANEARFAEILAKKPIFKDWAPSPERGKDISSKMSW